MLKKSGSVIYGRGYAIIGYNTPYARTVHDGMGAHTQAVREHKRRNVFTGAMIKVRQHQRSVPARTGNPYLDGAIQDVLKRAPENIRNMIQITRYDREI